jgi:hypothetical protein
MMGLVLALAVAIAALRNADDCAPRRRERIASGASSNAMLRER